MLNADLKTLINLCQTNKASLKYFKDKHFWHEKFKHDHLPLITIDLVDGDWISAYQLLLKASKDAKLMMLVTEIEADESEYNLYGTGIIKINFNRSLEDDDLIKILLPNMIKMIHHKPIPVTNIKYHKKYDLVPDSIHLELIKPHISYHYELHIDRRDYEVASVESSSQEILNILTYFRFYKLYGEKHTTRLHKMTFENDNQRNIIDQPLSLSKTCIIKTIHYIQHH